MLKIFQDIYLVVDHKKINKDFLYKWQNNYPLFINYHKKIITQTLFSTRISIRPMEFI